MLGYVLALPDSDIFTRPDKYSRLPQLNDFTSKKDAISIKEKQVQALVFQQRTQDIFSIPSSEQNYFCQYKQAKKCIKRAVPYFNSKSTSPSYRPWANTCQSI